MSRLKNINFDYNKIKDLVCQLAFEKKIALISVIIKDKDYRGNFYEYSASLARKYNIPEMNETELDNYLHK
jgi:hypothetical protein